MTVYGKRIKIVNKIKFIFVMSILFLTVLCVIMLLFNSVSGDDVKQYDVYLVKKGDTLWYIAKELTGEKMDVREAIYDIIQINDISPREHIYPGQDLKLPIYP
ncbi:MAG: LysM peptidoglycan-binding domain-containing protein [Eubacteriales bacterium]